MITIRSLFIAIAMILFSVTCYAQYDNEENINKNVRIEKRNVSKGRPNHSDALKLNDQQKNDIKKIRMKSKKTIMPLNNLLVEKRAHIKTLSVAEKVEMEEINKTIDEISLLHSQIMKQREAAKQEIRKLLSEEQRLIFDSRPPFRKKFHKRIIEEFHEE